MRLVKVLSFTFHYNLLSIRHLSMPTKFQIQKKKKKQYSNGCSLRRVLYFVFIYFFYYLTYLFIYIYIHICKFKYMRAYCFHLNNHCYGISAFLHFIGLIYKHTYICICVYTVIYMCMNAAILMLFHFIAFSVLFRLSDAVTLRDFYCAFAKFVMTCAVSWSVIDFNQSHVYRFTHTQVFFFLIIFVAFIVFRFVIVFCFLFFFFNFIVKLKCVENTFSVLVC